MNIAAQIVRIKLPSLWEWDVDTHHFNKQSETNVMYFLFQLLRIEGFYMFRALLAHPQEAMHKRHLVYCMRVMSVGC
jgi:hypothetical protein